MSANKRPPIGSADTIKGVAGTILGFYLFDLIYNSRLDHQFFDQIDSLAWTRIPKELLIFSQYLVVMVTMLGFISTCDEARIRARRDSISSKRRGFWLLLDLFRASYDFSLMTGMIGSVLAAYMFLGWRPAFACALGCYLLQGLARSDYADETKRLSEKPMKRNSRSRLVAKAPNQIRRGRNVKRVRK